VAAQKKYPAELRERYLELRVSRGHDLRCPVVDSVAGGTLAA
jgi:hypothetical protein